MTERKPTVESSWVEGAPAYALDDEKGWVNIRISSIKGKKAEVKDGKRYARCKLSLHSLCVLQTIWPFANSSCCVPSPPLQQEVYRSDVGLATQLHESTTGMLSQSPWFALLTKKACERDQTFLTHLNITSAGY